MKASKFFIGFIIIACLSSCNQNEVYFSYNPVPKSGWSKDSLLTFDFNVKDTLARYDIFIHVRHFGSYPYQNFWMFLENTDAQGVVAKDTIECYLADNFGKWLGTGNAVKEMPVYYRQNVLLPDSGTYQIKIGHGMRDSLLTGIKDIGVRVEVVN